MVLPRIELISGNTKAWLYVTCAVIVSPTLYWPAGFPLLGSVAHVKVTLLPAGASAISVLPAGSLTAASRAASRASWTTVTLSNMTTPSSMIPNRIRAAAPARA